ncbi:uncharacterized protein LDX57_004343 [Aspergillus melleus]|uniref:uncharacterized protein n=1 Tax=Aspergillus melleus TaxID=138277 RepID=UPI001E8E2138|nr:uncharacterized protein LDX57_004343 [Aspergillus melleus]KAH8426608.1 hypothetical protein LDX57_004343 [Aspergillus melleus]
MPVTPTGSIPKREQSVDLASLKQLRADLKLATSSLVAANKVLDRLSPINGFRNAILEVPAYQGYITRPLHAYSDARVRYETVQIINVLRFDGIGCYLLL